MIFDTDILIWVQRGSRSAAQLIDGQPHRFISVQTYLELFQCAHDKKQHRIIRQFLADLAFTILPLSENIGHRAMIYVEEYTLSSGMRAGDAIIAATAVENNLPLATGNVKHFKIVKDLTLWPFKP
jgi:predicted nucleic acid-binding protein